jgi:hypothetical protein
MAWANRNGKRYYYRKRRDGRRVISEYRGTGDLAEMLVVFDELNRRQKHFEQEAERNELAHWYFIDREVNETLDFCLHLTKAALLIAGLHTHHGTWRRRNGRR